MKEKMEEKEKNGETLNRENVGYKIRQDKQKIRKENGKRREDFENEADRGDKEKDNICKMENKISKKVE